jgi:hypothetical protein
MHNYKFINKKKTKENFKSMKYHFKLVLIIIFFIIIIAKQIFQEKIPLQWKNLYIKMVPILKVVSAACSKNNNIKDIKVSINLYVASYTNC